MSNTATTSGGKEVAHDITQLIRLLESLDTKVSEDATQALRQQLAHGEGISALVRHYTINHSIRALELLCSIREPNDKPLLDRLHESLQQTPLSAIVLVGQIVQKEPSWLPKLPQHSLFASVLKQINNSANMVVTVAGLLLLSSLLPHCPLNKEQIAALLSTLIKAIEQLHRCLQKDAKEDDETHIHTAHLKYAIKQYFTLLYGIYPSNVLWSLREEFTSSHHAGVDRQRARRALFTDVVEPLLLAHVRIHPLLLLVSREKELSRERWAHKEPHDFVADCERILVDDTIPELNCLDDEVGAAKHDFSFFSTTSPPSGRASTIGGASARKATPVFSEMSDDDFMRSLVSRKRSVEADSPDTYASPSVAVGLETPPESRNATPIHPLLSRRDSITSNVILPTATLRRSTVGAEDLRSRRLSFGQRINSLLLLRPRIKSDSQIEPSDNSKSLSSISIDGITAPLPITTEETEPPIGGTPENVANDDDDYEPVFEHTADERKGSLPSQLEEGIEARESPPSLLAAVAAAGVIVDRESIDDESDAEVTQLLANKAVHFPPVQPPMENNDQVWDDFKSNEAQRFSVTSFMTSINRKRFISECPPPEERRRYDADDMSTADDNNGSRDNFKNNQDETDSQRIERIKRTMSCPTAMVDARDRIRVRFAGNNRTNEPSRMIAVSTKKTKQSMSTADDSGVASGGNGDQYSWKVILNRFPYLPLLKPNSIGGAAGVVDETNECQQLHDVRRESYMDASRLHHQCLADLGLADRFPGRIFDDMAHILSGLSPEKQIEVLSSRLALVNQHLLYERCRRLIHAQRNRRLFGRLKRQNTNDEEVISYKEKLHRFQKENENLIEALSDKRRENRKQKKQFDDIEFRLSNDLKKANTLVSKLNLSLNASKQTIADLQKSRDDMQHDIDVAKRRFDDADAQRLFAEQRAAQLNPMRAMLDEANQTIARLRAREDELVEYVAMFETANRARMSAENELRHFIDEHQKELNELRAQLKHEAVKLEASQKFASTVKTQLHEHQRRIGDLHEAATHADHVHQEHIEAGEQKFRSLMSVCRRQEAHIVELYRALEEKQQVVHASATASVPFKIPIATGVQLEISSCGSSKCGSGGGASAMLREIASSSTARD